MKMNERRWRTQVRFLCEDPEDTDMWLVQLPGWHRDDVARVRLSVLPHDVRVNVDTNYRCHAKVNIGADKPQDLTFADWETR